MTGPSAGPRCADGLMVCAKRNSMFPNAMESALTATTSSPATTTALTTCNGCRILVIKRKRSVRTQRGTPSASECENIRRNVSPACSTDPSGVGGDSPGLPVKPPDSTSDCACVISARFSQNPIFIGTFPGALFWTTLHAVWGHVAFPVRLLYFWHERYLCDVTIFDNR